MKQLINKRFNETIYSEVLENGLTVYIAHKPNFRQSVCVFSTPFGAINLHQKINGEEIKWNAGLAHFLEHKLFEKQDMDVLSMFTNLGANANAYTSYQETNYYFSTTLPIKEPLNLLLDFVQSIDLTPQSVDKEKGIIIEELKMYQEIPNFQMVMKSFEALYHKHALKYDIAGSVESVTAITKEELEKAYFANYHPSQMVLSIATSLDPMEVLDLVKKNQRTKTFDPVMVVEQLILEEPITVQSSDEHLIMNVNRQKNAITYKQHNYKETPLENYRLSLITRLILDMNFSSLEDDFQSYLDQGLINDSFSSSAEYGVDYGFIQFSSEGESMEVFEEFINEKVRNLIINPDSLVLLKKRYLGQNISDLGDFESVAIDNAKAHQLETNLFELIEMIESIEIDDLIDSIQHFDFSNKSKVIITNK